jgi:hypothetical protein
MVHAISGRNGTGSTRAVFGPPFSFGGSDADAEYGATGTDISVLRALLAMPDPSRYVGGRLEGFGGDLQ